MAAYLAVSEHDEDDPGDGPHGDWVFLVSAKDTHTAAQLVDEALAGHKEAKARAWVNLLYEMREDEELGGQPRIHWGPLINAGYAKEAKCKWTRTNPEAAWIMAPV